VKILGENVISQGYLETNPTFTLDNKTIFFSKGSLNNALVAIFYSTLKTEYGENLKP